MNDYPQYYVPAKYIPTTSPYINDVFYWKRINKRGATKCYSNSDCKTYIWKQDLWDGWLKEGIIRRVTVEELALII